LKRRSILIHACCAPCASYVYELLSVSYSASVFYYNPNIAPHSEYGRRLTELERFAELKKFRLVTGSYDQGEWTERVREYRFCGEKSERCAECYRMRLEALYRKAGELGVDAVTTTLSVSPHKDAGMINRIGKELDKSSGIEFIAADFKKGDGYKKSVDLSRAYGFYRQDYCGCVYSKIERDKNFSGTYPEGI
jgi:predicted adenine nucleotide alpha hydrolase (AANH) superfamily ATPase